jgi:hypothetical protein
MKSDVTSQPKPTPSRTAGQAEITGVRGQGSGNRKTSPTSKNLVFHPYNPSLKILLQPFAPLRPSRSLRLIKFKILPSIRIIRR